YISNFYNGIGAVILVTMAMYPSQMIYSICGSQLAQSSPYKKAIMTFLPTVITFCSSTLTYLIVIGIEGIRAVRNPEAAEYGASMILFIGVAVLLLDVYVGIAYKYFVVSIIVMVIGMAGAYYMVNAFENGTMALSWLSGISMPVAIVVGLCLTMLGSLLQYGVFLLVYKQPVSHLAIYGLLCQQS
ncbi:MAG: hypothetical protein K2O34_03730, partial [Acetatifactor sp.]|nr:hypothetical protein [Acetatifactor sp.]